MKITIGEIPIIWNVLNDMVQDSTQPFRGNARRLMYNLQPEVKYLKEHPEDFEAIKDKTIDIDTLPPPSAYPDEYKRVLEKICEGLPEKKSQIETMIGDNHV